jgi:hypothetical protein
MEVALSLLPDRTERLITLLVKPMADERTEARKRIGRHNVERVKMHDVAPGSLGDTSPL